MDEVDTRKWENIDIDILVKIFQDFDVFELTSGLAHVCSMWRYAACEVLLKALDLSMLKSDFIRVTEPPYVYVNSRSDKQLTKLLKISLNLSHGSISNLFFHFYQYLSDDQLTYIAKRYHLLRQCCCFECLFSFCIQDKDLLSMSYQIRFKFTFYMLSFFYMWCK